jgi:DNA-binding CsgD family transcriptional regulator
VSVRTVDNHLQRVYRKLGVARREDLAGRIAATSE